MASSTTEHPDMTSEDTTILQTFPNNSTKKNTQWSVALWNNWRSLKAFKNPEDEKIPSLYYLLGLLTPQIDKHLARFITELKRPNGEDLTFQSVRAIMFGAQRYARVYAKLQKKQTLLFVGDAYLFPEFNKALNEKEKALATQTAIRKAAKIRAEGISVDKEKLLWDMNIFGCHSSQAFSDTIYFYIIKIFGFVSSISLRLMRIEHFEFSEDEYGKYVEIDKDFAKDLDSKGPVFNRSHGIELQTGKLRHYCDPTNPRTFCNLLKRYIKEVQNAQTDATTLLLTPKKGMHFSSHPLGRNNLQRNFHRIMNAANLKGYYTNVSIMKSVAQRLLASGYNIKKQRSFQISNHLQICKILDPPVGSTITEAFTSQTRAIYQLGTLQNSQQYATLPVHCTTAPVQAPVIVNADQPSMTGLPGSLQVIKTLDNTNLLTYKKVTLSTVLPETPHQASSLSTGELVPISGGHHRSGVGSSTCETMSCTAAQPLNQNEGSPYSIKPGSVQTLVQTMEKCETQEAGKGEEQVNKEAAYPLFMSTTDPQDAGEEQPVMVFIKQEPLEPASESAHNNEVDHNDINHTCENNDANKMPENVIINQTSENERNKNLKMLLNRKSRKRKHGADRTDVPAKLPHNDSQPGSITDDSSSTDKAGNDATNEHSVDIEYSYTHDTEKQSVKQAVSVTDDEQSVFSFTGSTKFGKTISDLELSLGDYLPDDGYVKVSDIKLKRVVTSNGGKVIFQLKYAPKCTNK